jgi:predicted nucleotidyltransferase
VAESRHPPLITDRVVALDPLVGVDTLWRVIVDIAAVLASDEWVLIGGQMVVLHGFIAGVEPPRATTDIDIVADVLARKGMLERCASALESMQLQPRPSITGKSLHRFVGERATVDLVVPDHLPTSAAVRLRGYSAVPITGGRRALDRAGRVAVTLGSDAAEIVVPDLRGAIVLKARAASADRRDNERHVSDVAFLCSLVTDPLELAVQLDSKERRSLRRIDLANDTRSTPWVFLEPSARLDALDAWRELTKMC